ncbi:AraC family transcriptional regulator [Paraflavitalea speifideaquila]|uniref:AraC family transcriptional regulator n=1 Tax=Paraflavitalea speifideaquila TaxID=3076558 RepID=UPI0028E57781|nr:AraC family transcriptional regulator [Paraflavitalea speifideiaquila]
MGMLGDVAAVTPAPTAFKFYHLPTIEQAQDYLLRHFREDISLQQLAQHCHASPFHFSRLFKAVLGVAPHQYLLGIRLHQAKRLLTESQQAVSDIAFECGFNSLEHFATAFRKRYEVSPSSFRRQLA